MFSYKLFFGFFIALCIVTASCNQQNNKNISSDIVTNPNTADGITDTTNLPVFKFAEEIHDFGKVNQGEKVSYYFKFKNIGKSDLIISDAKATCGCTVADYPKTPVAPGAEGTIGVTFNTEDKKDFQHKTITIIANTQPNTKVLSIKATIVVLEN